MTPAVAVHGVSKVYAGPPRVEALKDVTVDVPHGQKTAVIGPSGSGKSSLLNLFGALDIPTAGTVEILGENISEAHPLRRAEIRRQEIGFVFQSFHLLPEISVTENVELSLVYRDGGQRRRHRGLAKDVLTQVGLGDRWDAMPRHLSGGEQQRVAIARAMVGDPSIILLDEPTGNLDTASARKVLEVLDALIGPKTAVIIITHDPAIALWADRQLVLTDGKVAA